MLEVQQFIERDLELLCVTGVEDKLQVHTVERETAKHQMEGVPLSHCLIYSNDMPNTNAHANTASTNDSISSCF